MHVIIVTRVVYAPMVMLSVEHTESENPGINMTAIYTRFCSSHSNINSNHRLTGHAMLHIDHELDPAPEPDPCDRVPRRTLWRLTFRLLNFFASVIYAFTLHFLLANCNAPTNRG